jgi:hypothetical protein
MAGIAIVRKNRLDIAIEIDGLTGSGDRGGRSQHGQGNCKPVAT